MSLPDGAQTINIHSNISMYKYKLAIKKHIPEFPEITVEFEDKNRKEAIARSKIIIQKVAESYSKGYYTAKLYRKSFLFDWTRAITPKIACTNNG